MTVTDFLRCGGGGWGLAACFSVSLLVEVKLILLWASISFSYTLVYLKLNSVLNKPTPCCEIF